MMKIGIITTREASFTRNKLGRWFSVTPMCFSDCVTDANRRDDSSLLIVVSSSMSESCACRTYLDHQPLSWPKKYRRKGRSQTGLGSITIVIVIDCNRLQLERNRNCNQIFQIVA